MNTSPYDKKIAEIKDQISKLEFELKRIESKKDDYLNATGRNK